MLWDYFRICCGTIEEALDGTFGWYWDVLTLLLIVGILNFGIKRLLKYMAAYFKKRHLISRESLAVALYAPFSYYAWFVAFIESIDFVMHRLFGKSYFFDKKMTLAIGCVLALGWFLMRWKSNIVLKIAKSSSAGSTSSEASRVDVINKLVTVVIIFLTAGLLLEVTGSSLNTLIAFGGISGLAIAFASQEVIASFFGGLMIYLNQPFVIGDRIKLLERNIEGYITEIGWYTTKVLTLEKCPLYVPNSIFAKIVVMNSSRMTHRLIKETIALRYSDMPVLKNVIADFKDMLNSHTHLDRMQPMGAYFFNFGASSLDIQIIAYTKETSTESFNLIKEDLLFKINDVLEVNGAKMPFKTMCLSCRLFYTRPQVRPNSLSRIMAYEALLCFG